jgi:hypothetical protein
MYRVICGQSIYQIALLNIMLFYLPQLIDLTPAPEIAQNTVGGGDLLTP